MARIEINERSYTSRSRSRLMIIAVNHSIGILHMSLSCFSFFFYWYTPLIAERDWEYTRHLMRSAGLLGTSLFAIIAWGKKRETILATASTEYIIATRTCLQPAISLSVPAYCTLSLRSTGY
jgi:hypothetical protein